MPESVKDRFTKFQNFSSLQFIDKQEENITFVGNFKTFQVYSSLKVYDIIKLNKSIFQNFSSLQFIIYTRQIILQYIYFKTFQVYSS